MIFKNRIVVSMSVVLTTIIWPGILGKEANGNDATSWIENARKLQTSEFIQLCIDVFMSPDHMQQQSYLMSDFADEVTNLCLRIAPNPDQGTCKRNGFHSLKSSLKNAFFRHATQHMGEKELPIDLMMELGDVGYIVSDKSAIEQDVMRNDLCVEVHESIGDAFIQNIPVSNIPFVDPPDKSTESPPENTLLPIPASVPVPVPDEIELNSGKGTGSDNFTILYEKKEDEILSISGIVAISSALAAFIALFFYYEARRRNRIRINKMSRFDNWQKNIDEDGVTNVETTSDSRTVNSIGSTGYSSIEEIIAAIDNTDWDCVYKLASQIAENNDVLSSPTLGAYKGQKRSHLGIEDQERTKTLDHLVANGDWTGLAVTAALYAGETSGTSENSADNSFFSGSDKSPISSYAMSASQNEDIEKGQHSMETMVSSLSEALNVGNWSQVTKYANLIKNEKNSASSFDTDSQVLLSSPSSSSMISTDTSKTELSKKQTIAKLMMAGKWKGVSIMANMYEMESKQGHNPSSLRSYPSSPTHIYSDTRSIIRTKELRHSDRLQENIVGFRRDP
mmetsp:Transcript_8882/g.21717  ORF Transcript_8882/g.21717 Transcript_8882/m.21717 type:complete len:564 (-) Transcript_8882:86-1777(-)